MRKHIAAVAIATAALIGVAATPASARTLPERQATASIPNTAGAVTGWHLKDGTVYCSDLASGMCEWFTGGPYNNTVTSDTIAPGSVNASDLSAGVYARVFQPELGGLVHDSTLSPAPIGRIGGRYQDNATTLYKFTLQPGKYRVEATGLFDRTDKGTPGYLEPATDTYPQFTIRYGEDFEASPVNWGTDAGTFGGVPISRAGFAELSFSTSKVVELSEPTELIVRSFGYNEDRSAFGSEGAGVDAQFSVKSAQISAVKIG